MRKKWLLILVCICMVSVSNFSWAASREELAAIRVPSAGNFRYWSNNSPVKAKLVQYVENVTDEKKPDFIPAEDRIAVFDMDGTLMCETAPFYFDAELYLHRVFKDHSWQVPDYMRKAALETQKAIREKRKANLTREENEAYALNAFAGMPVADYQAYVRKFMQTPEEGLSNLKRGEAFYLPMVEVVSYLTENNFKVYIVSGCDRMALRVLVKGILPIGPERIIGTGVRIVASHQNGKDGLDYEFRRDDQLVRGKHIFADTDMNKVSAIAEEIGKQPVLAFGNSYGDASMLTYTISNNKYKSASFILLCDDVTRELGNLKKAADIKKTASDKGWVTVSMKNDFKTIYGDKVKRVK